MCFEEKKKFGNDFKQLCIDNKIVSEKDNWCLEFLLSSHFLITYRLDKMSLDCKIVELYFYLTSLKYSIN